MKSKALNNILRLIIEMVFGVMFFGFIILIVNSIMATKATPESERNSDLIMSSLKEKGVPVISVSVTQKSPLHVEIVIQSTSSNDSGTQDDMWYRHLASREAELAYLNGFFVESYRLIVKNSKGDVISSDWTYLNSEMPSQKLSMEKSSGLDNAATQDQLNSQLQLFGMTMKSMDVSNKIVRENTKFIDLQLSVPDTQDINKILDQFILSFRATLKKVNDLNNAHISLVRLYIKDKQDNVLLIYIYDLDTQAEHWSLAKGVKSDWFSHPVDRKTSQPIEPTLQVSPYPAPEGELLRPISTPYP
jgi:hypothetical protein